MDFMDMYIIGSMWAFGSALSAVIHREPGVAVMFMRDPPWWSRALEVILAAACSWIAVGLCAVNNGYRAAGQSAFACAVRSPTDEEKP